MDNSHPAAGKRGPERRPRKLLLAVFALLVAAITVVAVLYYLPAGPRHSPSSNSCAAPRISNETALLGTAFRPGIVAAFSANASSLLIDGNRGRLDPALVSVSLGSGSPVTTNLSSVVFPFSTHVGFFGTAWDGSQWVLPGTELPGKNGTPFLATMTGDQMVNITSQLLPFYPPGPEHDFGLFTSAMNGTAVLVGGNNSKGATLFEVQGGKVTDLTPLLPPSSHGISWVQEIRWNGSGWLIGGYHVFGYLGPHGYTDLLPGSPFTGNAVLAAASNGSAWMVGGGTPATLAIYQGDKEVAAPALPPSFGRWVNTIQSVGHEAWLVAGNGTIAGQPASPATFLFCGPSLASTDLTGELPSSFWDGQVQWSECIQGLGGVLIGGAGAYHGTYNYALADASGALALAQFGQGCTNGGS